VATVFACGIFGAMSGASTAAASVMSTIAYPEMRRHGYSEELAAGLPDAELHIIPDAGHLANLEQPAAFNACLIGFLKRL